MSKFDCFLIAGLVLWLIETAYFGWNDTPHSVAEQMFDLISSILIAYGVLGGLATALKTNVVINAENIRP